MGGETIFDHTIVILAPPANVPFTRFVALNGMLRWASLVLVYVRVLKLSNNKRISLTLINCPIYCAAAHDLNGLVKKQPLEILSVCTTEEAQVSNTSGTR